MSTLPSGPLIAIVGPTASGKTEWAERLAHDFSGELISADSRQIYRELDIAAAKPPGKRLPDGRFRAESGATYRLVDLISPDETMNLARFQGLAWQAWREIVSRGKLPIVVGGTGLYVEAIVSPRRLPEVPPRPELREYWAARPLEELRREVAGFDPVAAERIRDRRRLIRSLEILSTRARLPEEDVVIRDNILLIGPDRDPEELRERIRRRAELMFRSGVVAEAKKLFETYSPDLPALSGIIYPILLAHLEGRISLEEAQERFIRADWQLARRQRTWWRRRPEAKWVKTYDDARRLVEDHLRKHLSNKK